LPDKKYVVTAVLLDQQAREKAVWEASQIFSKSTDQEGGPTTSLSIWPPELHSLQRIGGGQSV
jgi:hypothetical protein